MIRPGPVIWITGYSGAGKTTVAQRLRTYFIADEVTPINIDGDVMRSILGRERGYARADRQELASIYARLCRELSSQGIPVICATISMFHDVRAWNRANIPYYYEVYLKVPAAELVGRNSKGLHGPARTVNLGPMVGFDESAEEPVSPDLAIDNWGSATPDQTAAAIWKALKTRWV